MCSGLALGPSPSPACSRCLEWLWALGPFPGFSGWPGDGQWLCSRPWLLTLPDWWVWTLRYPGPPAHRLTAKLQKATPASLGGEGKPGVSGEGVKTSTCPALSPLPTQPWPGEFLYKDETFCDSWAELKLTAPRKASELPVSLCLPKGAGPLEDGQREGLDHFQFVPCLAVCQGVLGSLGCSCMG